MIYYATMNHYWATNWIYAQTFAIIVLQKVWSGPKIGILGFVTLK